MCRFDVISFRLMDFEQGFLYIDIVNAVVRCENSLIDGAASK